MYLKMVDIMAKELQTPNYIKNGLIFMLDGICTGNNVGYWTDLVGGAKLAIGSNVVRGDKYFEFAKGVTTDDMCIDNKIEWTANQPTGYNNLTIEFVAEFASGSTYNYIFTAGSISFIVLAWMNGLVTPGRSQAPRWNMGNATKLSTYTWTFSAGYRDLVSKPQQTTDYWNINQTGLVLGGQINNAQGRNFGGKLYALRIYDRQLSASEIIANQTLDINRFGIQV